MNAGMLRSSTLVLAAFAFTCCGSPPLAEQDAPAAFSAVDDAETPGPAATEPEGCGMVFSPVPELLEETEAAAARWSAATGCDVRVGEGGVPVVFVDPIADGLVGIGANGESASGGVYRYESTGACAQIGQVAGHSTGQTIAHEIGHCIGQPGHTEYGLMSPYAEGPLDATSLQRVCDVFPCVTFSPET